MAEARTIALVGSESLLGREIRDVFSSDAPDLSLRLIATETEDAGTLTRLGDEPAIVEEMTEESLAGARAIVLAAPGESSQKALELAPGVPVIDLTDAAEERPDARLRAPMVEAAEDEEDEDDADGAAVHVIAHPAAIALALLLRRLHAGDPLRAAVVQIFAPASERGNAGIEELQQQTVALLSLKTLPKAVYDAQAAFNMLARYGDDAPVALEEAELRIERHLATLLALPGDGEGAPMPSLRVIQAPVFHGYSFSLWVEFETNPGVEVLEESLGAASIEVRGPDVEPPTNVGQAGMSGIAVGAIQEDRNNSGACWLWLAADNLRLLAENALSVVREVV